MKDVVWGIIGCGDVAEIKSGPAFQTCENSSLLAVMRRNKEKAQDFAKRHNVPLFFDTAESILNHPEINAVYIATPPSTHLSYAIEALKHNKNVYLEKPMTLNSEEAKALCEALESSNSKLTVAHYRRQLPAFLKVEQLLKEGVIGDIIYADIQILQPRTNNIIANTEDNWRLNPIISGGGYFHDLAPHQIDLILKWFGKAKWVKGFNSEAIPNVSTTVNGVIEFESGVQFRGLWSFNVSEANKKDECLISGTKGYIKFSFFGDKVELHTDGETTTFQFENPKHIQQPMIQNTVDYFLGKKDNPCTADEGLSVMEIMDTFTKKA